MGICPSTFNGCIDDLCYGSGCLKAPGEVMLMKCSGCKQLVGIDGTNPLDACECEDSDMDDDDED